jgi:MFS family permease
MTSSYLAPLRHRDFALLWSGQTVSMLGDGVFTVTLALETLRVDPHPIGLSYVLAARLLPAVVFVLLGGAIADRVPRRLAMLGSDLARGAAVAAITVLVVTGAVHLAALVVLAFVFGLADALFFPALTAITPELVPAELLVGASALNGISTQLAQVLIGPAVGGVIAGLLGTAWGFGIDAASFAVSAVCLAAMTASPKPAPSQESPLRDILAGLRYVRSQRWLWVSILGSAVGNFVAFSPLGALVPLLVTHSRHGGGIALGLVLGAPHRLRYPPDAAVVRIRAGGGTSVASGTLHLSGVRLVRQPGCSHRGTTRRLGCRELRASIHQTHSAGREDRRAGWSNTATDSVGCRVWPCAASWPVR